jgi:hypothetical protein
MTNIFNKVSKKFTVNKSFKHKFSIFKRITIGMLLEKINF